MLICDLHNSAAVRDELFRWHVPFGVIGLPADDFKVRDRFCLDVVNGRQHRHLPFVSSSLFLALLVVVGAQQLWIQLGTVVRIKAVAAVKCLINGFYRLLDGVFATTSLVSPGNCNSLSLEQFSVCLIAEPNPARSIPPHTNTTQ